MSAFHVKRTATFALAVILASFLLISALLGVYGKHDHTCSPNRCLLCLATGALSVLRDTALPAAGCVGISLILLVLTVFLLRMRTAIFASLVSLKTKITS